MRIRDLVRVFGGSAGAPLTKVAGVYIAGCAIGVATGWHVEVFAIAAIVLWSLRGRVDVRMPWWSDMRTLRYNVENRRNATGWTRIAQVADRATDEHMFPVYARFAAPPDDGDDEACMEVAVPREDGTYWRGPRDDLSLRVDAEGRGGLDLSGIDPRFPQLRLLIEIGATHQKFLVDATETQQAPWKADFPTTADTPEMQAVKATIDAATYDCKKDVGRVRRQVARSVHPDRGAPERRQAREDALKAANEYLDDVPV